jgi:DNA gyrase inhibitor GyrI
MTDDTQELVEEVFKSDMKTAEKMRQLVETHDLEEVSEASVQVVNDMHDKVDEPHREKCLYATCYQIGNAIGNEQLVQFAAEQLQRWEQTHG